MENHRMARITSLEADIEKVKRERENMLAEERVKASRHGLAFQT